MRISKKILKLSIIIPLFNEEENVDLLYCRLKDVLNDPALLYEIIFIDDGSTDDTYQLLKRLKSSDEKIKVIKFSRNFGQSAALVAGFDIASGDFVITIDGDLQYNPQDIVRFLEMLQNGVDVVCGWRQVYGLCQLIKRIPSLVANFLGAFIFGLKVHDFSCSYRAYSKAFYKKLHLADGLHRFIPIFAKFESMSIREIKISCSKRNKGTSKYTFLRFPKVIKDAIFLKITELFFDKTCSRLFKKTNFIIDTVLS